jgi:hypothetical protein
MRNDSPFSELLKKLIEYIELRVQRKLLSAYVLRGDHSSSVVV